MSRWFTPASSASRKPRSASSAVQRANAAPPRMATDEWWSVRPRRRVSMASDSRLGAVVDDDREQYRTTGVRAVLRSIDATIAATGAFTATVHVGAFVSRSH